MGSETLEKLPLEGIDADEELLDSLAERLAERVGSEPRPAQRQARRTTVAAASTRRGAALDQPLSTRWAILAAAALAAVIAGAFVLIALFGPAPTP